MNANNGANIENKSKNLQYSQSGSKSYVEIELGCSIMRSCEVKCHVSFHSYISNKLLELGHLVSILSLSVFICFMSFYIMVTNDCSSRLDIPSLSHFKV